MSLPYYTLYPKDFDADEHVRIMTFAEKGLYLTLLNSAWVNEGLPSDLARIARLAGASADEFATLWPAVEPCFPVAEDGRRRNERQERERKTAISKMERTRAANESRLRGRKRDVIVDVNVDVSERERGTRAYESDSLSGSVVSSEKGSAEGKQNLRQFPKVATVPADPESAKQRSVSLWTAAGFEGPEQANAWWNALVAKHPNPGQNNFAYGRWLEVVQLGQFDRTEFERWYEEQVPIWAEWMSRNVQAKNLNDIFADRLWKFKAVPLPKPPKTDRERGLAG